MGNIAVKAERLCKKYSITVGHRADQSLAGRLADSVQRLISFERSSRRIHYQREDVWSLRDVSFEIAKGDVVGIIGRNGAGKSTLLKILSRITEPTSGRAEIFGRVGTLLEVGTGFHPDLTGRDNIYLSGSILGMGKSEITRKFDEIVAFAGIEQYIDTPVKRYSTGMYVRLAFAVGAHLEPEVLIVDEVLAVGDMQFQKKCLDRMHYMGEQGRTVIFVSHNMQAVTRLCRRVLYLERGQLVGDGPTHQVVSSYLHSGVGARSSREWIDQRSAPGDDRVRLRGVRVRLSDGRIDDVVDIRQGFAIEIEFEVLEESPALTPSLKLIGEDGITLFEALDLDPDWRRRSRPQGRYVSTAWVPGNFLGEGTFFVSAWCLSLDPYVIHFGTEEVIAFQVIDNLEDGSARGDYMGELEGAIRPMLKWSTQFFPVIHS
ncbi:ABC transporter [Nitrospira tepida]|uniref:ABC transporter n=1 Tax=Nitrospira tepida TaxID=2973512 RepID=A0AA86T6L4_9BACT|nr:polysaccharide ABC transporter ATP-binding protein [Nitrospira tepida]CAI4032582.1 ABC transporter [Nitrospira tepida]